MMRPFSLALAGLLCVSLHATSADEKIRFNRDIRPIFSDTCFQCHGPDEKERKAGLRLDTRETAVRPAESGEIAIVPGNPEGSELVRRLVTKDRDDLMPPAKLHKTIQPEQIEKVKKWIAQGAEYEGHWAFIPPVRPAVPQPMRDAVGTPDTSHARNAIDHFISSRLEREGLTPSVEADKATLIRRVSLDLTGLPPAPADVEAFVADPSPEAYEKVVDRLLASPRYGERMAIEWLDHARYADSNGFQSDSSRQMWNWRDWVIAAFNRNQPFDQFTIEQLAGDLLPDATRAQIVATGFHRNARLNGEGGRIVEEWFAETVIDRVETTGLTWLGLTFNCCRCHDHKYDPITQKEFYQLFAFFNSGDENGVLDDFGGAGGTRRGGNSRPILDLPTAEQEAQLAQLEREVEDAQQRVAAAQRQLPQWQREWEVTFAAEQERQGEGWAALNPAAVQSAGGATLTRQEDGSWLASGTNPPHDTYTITAPLSAGTFSGVRLDALPDPALPNRSLGRHGNGNFVLTGVEAEITAPTLREPLVVDFKRAEADYEQKGYEVKSLLEGKTARGKKGWAVDGPTKREPRQAMFVVGAPITVPPEATITVRLKHESSFAHHNIGRFRLNVTSQPPAVVTLGGGQTPDNIRHALATGPAQRTSAQRAALTAFFRANTDNPASRAEAEVAAAKKKVEQFRGALPSTMIMKELAQPREAFLLTRGEYDRKGERVERGVPASLPPLPPGAPLNRLGLAQWIVSPENPLTARVWVNRAWERFFGIGLVRSTENLGSQAEWPSHPELLDWLATEFVRLKWDMKAMQKTMVMSATYRQSSKVTPGLVERDPENRLLARGPRFRLPAESIRDQALAASGLLVEKVGGPSVRPYMPAAVWDETSKYGDMRGYKADIGEGLYRRSLYTVWKRTASPPSMTMFDSPTRETCTIKRSRTNTPLQALSLLNEVTFVEAARVLAQRMIVEGGATPEERIAWAFRRVTCREPQAAEVQVLAAGLARRLAHYGREVESAEALVAVGAAAPDARTAAPELASYLLTANVLLNLDEVITRE